GERARSADDLEDLGVERGRRAGSVDGLLLESKKALIRDGLVSDRGRATLDQLGLGARRADRQDLAEAVLAAPVDVVEDAVTDAREAQPRVDAVGGVEARIGPGDGFAMSRAAHLRQDVLQERAPPAASSIRRQPI